MYFSLFRCYTVCVKSSDLGKESGVRSIMKKNIALTVVSAALQRTALFCSTGTLMQTFLSLVGFSANEVYIHSTVVQMVNVLTILIASGIGDRGRIIRRTALAHIPLALMFLCYLPLCFSKEIGAGAFVLLLSVSVIQSASLGIRTVLDYKLPYFLYTAKDYADVNAISGVVTAALGLVTGALVSYLSAEMDYVLLMVWAFVISALLMAAAGFLVSLQRVAVNSDKQIAAEKQSSMSMLDVIRAPVFLHLLAPNILRGFASGATTVVAIAALSRGYNEGVTSVMVSVESVAVFVAGFAFVFLARSLSSRSAILIGSLPYLAMPLLLVRGNAPVLLAAYAVMMLGRNIVDNAVPSALIFAVPVEMAGQYNALRMVLHNGGMLLATGIAVFIPTEALFISATAAQLISGALFYCLPIMKKCP